MVTLPGIDVSNYQGQIDWQQVAQSHVYFAAMKATEGYSYKDPTFPSNWKACKEAGIARIAYHFLRPNLDGDVQASVFHDYIHDHGGLEAGDCVMVDLEVTGGMSTEYVLASAEAFIRHILTYTGVGCYVYTGPNFWIQTLGNPASGPLGKCPLWIADYGPAVPEIPNWKNGATIWQYTSSATVPGIEGKVDADRFYGDAKTYQVLARKGGRS